MRIEATDAYDMRQRKTVPFPKSNLRLILARGTATRFIKIGPVD